MLDDTYMPPLVTPTGVLPYAVAIEDIDNDDILDLVVVKGGSPSLRIFRGVGDGTFTSLTSHVTGRNPRDIIIADLDGDVLPDLAVANESSGDVSVLLHQQ